MIYIKKMLGKIISMRIIVKEAIRSVRFMDSGKSIEVLLLCHALEKGMGINNVKPGYGLDKAARLISLVLSLQAQRKTDKYIFRESCSVIKVFLEYQKNEGFNVTDLEDQFKKIEISKDKYLPAGYLNIGKENFLQGMECNFEKLILSKHTLRMCSDESVSKKDFQTAVRYALKAPSACNRQPWKVFYSLDKTKNKSLGELVPGNKSFSADIPYYCVVTVDRSLFGSNEVYQWYINGGIFITYLTLSLHSIGIGSCIFQYPDFYKTEAKIRKLLCIKKKSEVIVAIIGYGKYPDEAKCIEAARKPVDEVAIEF